MTQPPEYIAPTRELFERIGVAISMLFYGINVCLFIQLTTADRRTKFNWMRVVTYTTFILVSLAQSLLSYVAIILPSRHLETSNSPEMWFGSSDSKSIQLAIMASGLSSGWILDGCMLYQCFIVYSIRRIELWIIGLPILFLCSSIGTGAYLIAGSAGFKVRVLPHYPLCISTKLVITALIAFKLLQQRRTMLRMFQVQNRKELIRPYTSLIRILTTSYALSSAVSVLFLGLYISNVGAWRIVLPSTIQAGLTSHLLVRFQVIQNRSQEKPFDETSLHFSTPESTNSQQNYC